MPFLYVYVCDLLEKLGGLVYRDCPLLVGLKEKTNKLTVDWFRQHKRSLNEDGTDDQAVLLTFTPEKRTDRDYGLDTERLEQLIARVLNLPRDLHVELRLWRDGPAYGDLGACVERVMDKMTWMRATRAISNKVTVDEIDQSLLRIASHNRNSSPQVRSLASNVKTPDTIKLLGRFYRRLQGREAKWLTRLILKDYGPVKFPDRLDFSSNMQFLPTCIRVNAEISISEAFPTLRDGQREIRGVASGSSTVNQPTPTMVMAAKNPKELIRVTVNPILTAPTTAPQPPSSAAKPTVPHVQIHSQMREPLAPLDLNSQPTPQSSGTKAYEPSSTMSSISTTRNIQQAKTTSRQPQSSSLCAISPRDCMNSSQPSAAKSFIPMSITGTGTCRLTSHLCPLINCIFLLAPCISTSPYIAEDLLSWHGSRTITSLLHLSDPSLPRRCPKTGRKYRKIALVESNRAKPTAEFLKRIQRLNLRRSGREKEKKQWVEVYDWRILECVAKVDKGKELGYSLWRRCWIGAV